VIPERIIFVSRGITVLSFHCWVSTWVVTVDLNSSEGGKTPTVLSGWHWRIILLQRYELPIELNVAWCVVIYIPTWRALIIESLSNITYTLMRPCLFVIIHPRYFNSWYSNIYKLTSTTEAHGSAVGWDTELKPGSIPDVVIAIFHWHIPSGRTMALGVDTSTNRNEHHMGGGGGKGGRYVGLTTLPHPCANRLKIWVPPNCRKPHGLSRGSFTITSDLQ